MAERTRGVRIAVTLSRAFNTRAWHRRRPGRRRARIPVPARPCAHAVRIALRSGAPPRTVPGTGWSGARTRPRERSSARLARAAEERAEHAVELLSLAGAEHLEQPLLVRDVLRERLVDRPSLPRGVRRTSVPRRSAGSGRRSTRPASTSRSRRFVMPADESIVACISAVGFSSYGSPARRSAASRSNQPRWSRWPASPSASLSSARAAARRSRPMVPSGVHVQVGSLAPPLLEDRVEVIGHRRKFTSPVSILPVR